ncbi:hypothetical protein LBMAG56_33740 [Verrucomicrobiota bacterium]|nr:hypothetical protein LBMAG56_33740 [Verrucomicrobiota bacterium]
MDGWGDTLWTGLRWALFFVAVGWVGHRWLRRCTDWRARLRLVQWAVTGMVVGLYCLDRTFESFGYRARGIDTFIGYALVLVVVWLPSLYIARDYLADAVARFLTSFYDGGGREVEPRPVYSRAKALMFRSQIPEAVAEIRLQLEKFPTDYEGQMFLAELQAGHLNDLPAAQITIERLIEQPGHAPAQIAAALTTLAEWHLKFSQDPVAARAELAKIPARFPGTQVAQIAEQRLASLPSVDHVMEAHDRRKLRVEDRARPYAMGRPDVQMPVADTPAEAEQKLLQRLERYPRDNVTREQLVLLYADQFERLDWATRQLEIMIAAPNQQPREVVGWLERIADLQQRFGAEKRDVRRTLQRIIERFPNSAGAERARSRIFRLGE